MRTQTGTANDMHIIIAHMFMFIIMLTTVFLICLIPFEYIYYLSNYYVYKPVF